MTTIQGGNHRYLSELPEFADGLPHGIVNKTKTDVGGTFLAATCRHNYLIVCPFIDLVKSIASDPNLQAHDIEVFQCYGGIKRQKFDDYLERRAGRPLKIASTYDSMPKILRWMQGRTHGWRLLVDEYHLILEDHDFRTEAIDHMMQLVERFSHFTFLSATPIDEDFEIEAFARLPHYRVEWSNLMPIYAHRIHASHMTKALVKLIQTFRDGQLSCPNVDGIMTQVRELFVFVNSVRTIRQVCDTLALPPSEVKVCCADRKRNELVMGDYEIESSVAPNKPINFFTKKCFQGCNLFSNNGLIVVASDGGRQNTLVDVSTTMEQIAGRLRENDHCSNCFKDHIVHIYTTSNRILTDEEFGQKMADMEASAELMLSLQDKATPAELDELLKRVNVETDLLSIEDGRLVLNPLKRKSFIFKHKVRSSYRNDMSLKTAYVASGKIHDQHLSQWRKFDIQLASMVKVGYQDLLRDYIETLDPKHLTDHPEFADIVRLLSEKEIASCKWNPDKIAKCVDDKRQLRDVFMAIYDRGRRFTNAELKEAFRQEFERRGITLAPKATLILDCRDFEVHRTSTHYTFGQRTFDYDLSDIASSRA